MEKTSYAVALGSNRRHGRHGRPAQVLDASIRALAAAGLTVTARSGVRNTPAMGDAGRSFANAAILIESELDPAALLRLLKSIERAFGRRRGRRWGPRVLDLDILLCSRKGGAVRGSTDTGLAIPHPGLAVRNFVLHPLEEIAPRWRHPRTGLTVRQLRARLRRARPLASMPVDRFGPRP